jgi:hypothetical protein
MHNHPNTDTENESASLDAEDWEIALKPYSGHPDAALDLARNFMVIKEYLMSTPPDVPQAIAALDEAADSVFPLTAFHKGSHDLYRIFIEGHATRAHEALMESLGVNF